MKKVLTFLIVVALVAPIFTSCYFKKGENDPSISLKSRKARLVGEWTLVEWTRTTTSTSSGSSSTTTYTYSGSTLLVSSGGTSYNYVYSESLEVVKDGTYSHTTNESGDGWSYIENSEGTWSFVAGDKENGIASQERVILTNSTSTTTYGGSTGVYTSDGDPGSVAVMRINKLSGKEMIITREFTENDGGDLYTISEEQIWEKD